MFRINPLSKKVLITTDEVIAVGPTEDNPGERNLLLSIQIAEDRFIRQALGTALYDDFRNEKNVLITDVNQEMFEGADYFNTPVDLGALANAIELCNPAYQRLWYEHLWKLTAECVVYIATLTNWSRHTASGEMVNNPKSISSDSGSGGNSVDLNDIKFKLSRMQQDRIDPLIASMQEYLFINMGSYPLYSNYQVNEGCDNYNINGNKANGVSYKRKTAWVHVYDRHRRDCDYDKY